MIVARLFAHNRLVEPRAALWLAVFIVSTQLAYYTVDAFTDYRLPRRPRRDRGDRDRRAGDPDARARRSPRDVRPDRDGGLFGLVLIQFATFHRDYLGESQARGSADVEGNMRGAFESVIERTGRQQVPAIYLGKIGPYYYGELFWKFYLIKHHREDLLAPNDRRHGVQARTRADAAARESRHHQPDPADRPADRWSRCRERCAERAQSAAEGAGWRAGFLDSTDRWGAVSADRDEIRKRTNEEDSQPAITR